MKKPQNLAGAGRREVPAEWRDAIHSHLDAGETVLAWLETDLDARLRFETGMVLATDRRILACAPGRREWSSWPYSPDLRLALHDHAGAASLELDAGARRLASWRFTLGRNPAALRLLEQFESLQALRLAGAAPTAGESPGHARPARRRSPPIGKTVRSAARSPPPRRRPGRCCGCGGSRGPIAARCWPDSC